MSRITSPGRRELRRQLELTHRRIVHGGRREMVAYKWSDQLSRVDLVVRVSAIARAAAEAAAYGDGEIVEDVGGEEVLEVRWETHAQQKQIADVIRRDLRLQRTGRKAHHQPCW